MGGHVARGLSGHEPSQNVLPREALGPELCSFGLLHSNCSETAASSVKGYVRGNPDMHAA